jgi:transcriptional regulator with XRE-family HTH domain
MEEINSATEDIPVGLKKSFSNTELSPHIFSNDKLKSLDAENNVETIRRALSAYDIGRKLKQLRLRKKIALVDLGKHTGLSASMLSQLENGKLIPTLPTLARIAMVFDVGVDHFFFDRRRKRTFAITRQNERIRFPERPDAPRPAYFFECLAFSAQDKSMQAYIAQFPKRRHEDTDEHFHEGSELIHVLEGTIELRYQEEAHTLRAGDSVYFDSAEPHSYCGLSKSPARAIIITTPPR